MGTAILVDGRELALCRQMQLLVISLFAGAMLDNNSGVNLVVPGDTALAWWSCGYKYEHLVPSLKVNMVSNGH